MRPKKALPIRREKEAPPPMSPVEPEWRKSAWKVADHCYTCERNVGSNVREKIVLSRTIAPFYGAGQSQALRAWSLTGSHFLQPIYSCLDAIVHITLPDLFRIQKLAVQGTGLLDKAHRCFAVI